MTTADALFTAHRLGGMRLANRIVMAPMTRARCPDLVPGADTASYYAQRASAGLLISEAIPVCPGATGYAHVPEIGTEEQRDGWRSVTSAVHDRGGRIYAQLWHVGRVSHRSLQPDGAAPGSSSAEFSPKCRAFVLQDDGTLGFVEATPPRALTEEEIADIVVSFGTAASNARSAGFDGVEIHGANGYLFEQFLNPHVNRRTDRYGGSIAGRSRLLLDVVDEVLGRVGPARVGVRLSPFGQVFGNPAYAEAEETYRRLVGELGRRGVGCLHLHDLGRGGRLLGDEFLARVRSAFGGTVILAGGLTGPEASRLVAGGLIDLAGFGRPFVSNPDLAERLRQGWPLADPDPATFYGGGPAGYLDYAAHETA